MRRATSSARGILEHKPNQALQNVQTALAAAGARLEHVITWSIYLTQGQPLQPGIAAFQRVWGNRPNPLANTVVYVPELVPADLLVAITASPRWRCRDGGRC